MINDDIDFEDNSNIGIIAFAVVVCVGLICASIVGVARNNHKSESKTEHRLDRIEKHLGIQEEK